MSGVLTANMIEIGTPNGASFAMEIDEDARFPDIVAAARNLAAEHCHRGVTAGTTLLCIVNVTGYQGTGVAWQAVSAVTDTPREDLALSWCALLEQLIAIAIAPPPLAGTPAANAPTTETPQ